MFQWRGSTRIADAGGYPTSPREKNKANNNIGGRDSEARVTSKTAIATARVTARPHRRGRRAIFRIWAHGNEWTIRAARAQRRDGHVWAEMFDGCVLLRSVAERLYVPERVARTSYPDSCDRGEADPWDSARRAERRRKGDASIRRYIQCSKRKRIARQGLLGYRFRKIQPGCRSRDRAPESEGQVGGLSRTSFASRRLEGERTTSK